MNKPKHTPGPWVSEATQVVSEAKFTKDRTYGYGCANDFICSLEDEEYHNYINNEEMEANARLIAAAPEMLELLQLIDKNSGELPSKHQKKFIRVLAKAEGKD